MTAGEIGTFEFQGKQIGGFLDWHIDTFTEKTDGIKAKTLSKAQSFWMLDDCATNEFEASFFQKHGDKLILIQKAKVRVTFPSIYHLDMWERKPIEMAFL